MQPPNMEAGTPQSLAIMDRFRGRTASYAGTVVGLFVGFGGILAARAANAHANDNEPAPSLDNADVHLCQQSIIGTPGFAKGLINSEKIHSKIGASSLKVNLQLNEIQMWSGEEFWYGCDSVTDNTLSLRLVVRNKGKATAEGVSALLRADDDSRYSGVRFATTNRTTVLKLTKKLTQNDIKSGKYGVRATIKSRPTIQVPHLDPYNGSGNFPGPMETVSRTTVKWLR